MPVLSAPSITPQQCRDAFNLFDTHKNGELNADEFKYAILALGFGDKTEAECRAMIAAANGNMDSGSREGNHKSPTYHRGKKDWKGENKKDNGSAEVVSDSIHYDAFEHLCLGQALTWEQDLVNVFKMLNVSGSGKISAADLKEMARIIGENDADPIINQMIVEADVNDKDGEVNFDEFKKIMLLSISKHKTTTS